MTANCVRSGRKFVIGAASISGQAEWGGGNERVEEKGDDKMRSGRKKGGGGGGVEVVSESGEEREIAREGVKEREYQEL